VICARSRWLQPPSARAEAATLGQKLYFCGNANREQKKKKKKKKVGVSTWVGNATQKSRRDPLPLGPLSVSDSSKCRFLHFLVALDKKRESERPPLPELFAVVVRQLIGALCGLLGVLSSFCGVRSSCLEGKAASTARMSCCSVGSIMGRISTPSFERVKRCLDLFGSWCYCCVEPVRASHSRRWLYCTE
jgi:hypothetical protein